MKRKSNESGVMSKDMQKLSPNHNPKSGFTVVELMISTVVFGTILLLCAVGFIQVGKLFYKGVSIMRSQEAARNLAEELIQEMQFTNNDVILSGDLDSDPAKDMRALCIGVRRYYIHFDVQAKADSRAVEKLTDVPAANSPCDTSSVMPNKGQELLPEGMRISGPEPTTDTNSDNIIDNGFYVKCNKGLCDLKIRVAFGENKTFTDSTHSVCKGSYGGSQFCGVSFIETSALRRIR